MIKVCSLYSGSGGNCIFFGCGKTKILIDAGLSALKTKRTLSEIGEDPSSISALIISHEHSDHINGAGIISKQLDIPVYANSGTWNAAAQKLRQVRKANRKTFFTGVDFEIGSISAGTFRIPHDACEPVAFNLFAGGRKITIATDMGCMTKKLLERMEKSDVLLLESNHDISMLKAGPYPWDLKQRILGNEGHLSNDIAARTVAYLAQRGTERFLLGHLSARNNFPELAYRTTLNIIEEKGIRAGEDILLDIAGRDAPGIPITIGKVV